MMSTYRNTYQCVVLLDVGHLGLLLLLSLTCCHLLEDLERNAAQNNNLGNKTMTTIYMK